jgi:hypothetical protein
LFVAAEICVHDVCARIGVLAFFDQIGESFVDKRLKLTSFLLGEPADGLQDRRIHLGGKLLAGLGHGAHPFLTTPRYQV